MAVDDEFTFLARGLNIGGGLGFLVAGAFFVRRFHQRQNHEDWLFAVHTILFGAAGILFELSALWDAAWWWWHILRMAAYLAALTFAIRAYLDAEQELISINRQLNDLNRNLDQTVEERTAELSHERFLLQTLLEHLPDAIYFKDSAGRFTRVSHSLAHHLGREPHEMIGMCDGDFFPPEYAAEARADEEALMRSGEPLIGKEENPNWSDDKETWVSTTKVPLPDQDGQIIGTFGLSHDITAQKMAETNFRRVIDAAPNPLVVVDRKGTIELVNEATRRVFGYAQEQLIGQPIELLVPERLRREHEIQRRRFLQQPKALVLGPDRELSGRRKDGSEFPVEIGLNPVRLSNRTAVLASVLDVTARKQVRDALVAAKQAAETANQAKGDFLANMSHEIRTPMNAIIGMTELLLDNDLNSTQRDYLQTVLESAESLLAIINEILDFSKIEAGHLELEELEFDLRDELADTLRTLAARAFGKGLELAWNVAADVPARVWGDPIRMRQVLLNLVGNAIKFTNQGEVVVDVNCEELVEQRVTLRVAVRDTGVGIPQDRLDNIFSAFAQADSSTTRRFGGTGLGLTISARLVEAMGGRIWVESEIGTGSTFRFTMRLRVSDNPPRLVHELPVLENFPVLVVDDNATNRTILEQMLRNWGMRVDVVEGGRQAIEFLQRVAGETETLPLVLSDVNMPEMDGFTLAAQLRRTASLRDTVVILLTSGGRVGDAAQREALGINAQLMKPVKQSELLDAILVAVGQPSGKTHDSSNRLLHDLPRLQSLKVLLAEDGKANQKLAVGLLEKWGHCVTVAENGRAAVHCWEAEPFDLILMDLQMPEWDGFEATRHIREQEGNTGRHIPIIAMTAHAMAGDRERCLESGMDGYVAKPVRQRDLHDQLARFFKLAEPQAAPEPANDREGESEQIDWAVALKTVAGDQELLRDVVEECLQELPDLLTQLEAARESNDSAEAELPNLIVTDLQMPEMNGLELVECVRDQYPLIPIILMTAAGSEKIAVEAIEKGAASYVPKKELANDLVDTVARLLMTADERRVQRRLLNYLTEMTYELTNDLELLSALSNELRQTAHELRLFDEVQCLQFATAIDEALVNAFYHGNLEVSSELRDDDANAYHDLAKERRLQQPYCDRRIHVNARLDRSDVTVVIRDEGPGFDPDSLPDPTEPGFVERPHGRGLLLIRAFVDEVLFNDAGNEVTLIKRTQAPSDDTSS
eukprot:g33001.t1